MRKKREKTRRRSVRLLGLALPLWVAVAVAQGAVTLREAVMPAPEAPPAVEQPAEETPPAIVGEDWQLLLVNAAHPLPADFSVETVTVEGSCRVDSRAAEDLRAMLADMRAQGLSPVVCSSYRTRAYQQNLYDRKVNQYLARGYGKQDARAAAAMWVAPPDASEHQTGLAVDIVAASFQVLDERQAKTAEQQWLMAHCHEYGFILRYTADKSALTGIHSEPWHYRYVGRAAAADITAKGLCLEEYLAQE